MDKVGVQLHNLPSSDEDGKEAVNNDAPKNNPQFTTVYVGNVAPEAPLILMDTNNTSEGEASGSLMDPVIGDEFDTFEEAWEYWKRYSLAKGFSARKRGTKKRKSDGVFTWGLFVCSREGKKEIDKRRINSERRADTRCGCGVQLTVSQVSETGKYKVKDFIAEHNHVLEGSKTAYFLKGHRNINPIQARVIEGAADVGISPKFTHELMSKEAGGKDLVGYTREDLKTYLRTRRERDLQWGEAGSILKYFKEQKSRNYSFYSDIQLDCEENITNIYWADAKMLVDYHCFGDVVTFDTTFGTNKKWRPLGVFCGFNNHREIVIFGGALLFDETADSFSWLFETFTKSHGGKRPMTIFTDQDAAMQKALNKTMPDVYHGLCTWHISQNATKNLAGVLTDRIGNFISAFHTCMYEYTDEEEFENAWVVLLDCFGLSDNKWIDGIYKKKAHWSAAYMKNTFTAGVRSTQLSESFNSDLKDVLRCDLSIMQFFKRFERAVQQKRDKELHSDFHARQSFPHLAVKRSSIMQQAAQRYTPAVYALFSEQYDIAHAVILDRSVDVNVPNECIATVRGEGTKQFKIKFDPVTLSITCSCYMFETHGYLCGHALRVFDMAQVLEIPEKYILKRWTRHAKSQAKDEVASTNNLTNAQEINRLCLDLMRTAYRVAGNAKAIDIVRDLLKSTQTKLDEIEMPGASNVEEENEASQPINDCVGIKAKGLASKSTTLGGKRRKKAWYDKTNVPKSQQQTKKLTNIIAKRLMNHGSSSHPTKYEACSQENLSTLGSQGVGDDELTLTL